ncbi:hypothetical protein [Psychrosphaera algicola]|uniref:DUF1302 domain-containing protein n=1 Tax=Psychrosphaera algicola TaxID=3023714 RepID=A0ABT5FIN8_9GAMM|nr:hypothetical protein [Psychrosphaera sp. G1-22]MDC2891068.1 hypothetical protein [Psychrosphaera sp. G1-22]
MYNNTGDIYQNEPEDGQLYARPNDIRYAFSNTQRVRDNAQLTLQFRPTDRITGTLDYTFAENQLTEHRGEITNWMQNGDNVQQVIFDDSAVATPIYAKEAYSGGSDEGYEQQLRENLNTLTSLGVNFEFEVNDSLILRLDAHQSNMHSRGVGPRNSGELAVGLGAPIKTQTEWFWGADLPTFSNVYDDSIRGANNNGMVDAGDVGSSIARIRNASQETDISQVKFDGTYEFDDGRFDFGVEVSEMDSLSMQTAGNNIALGNWGVANLGEFGDILQPFDLAGEFNDYPTSSTPGYGFIGSPSAIYDAALNLYPGIPTESEASLSASNRVIESTTAAYMQIAVGGELNGMPFHVLTGLRFEKTEVESSSLVGTIFFSWEDNDDVVPYVDSNIPAAPFSATNSYDNLLPTFDFDIDITDDLKGRFSFSKTIARAGLGSLGVSASNFGGGGGSTLLGAKPTASASNLMLIAFRIF